MKEEINRILDHDELVLLSNSLLRGKCFDFFQIGGGRNSRVYKFSDQNNRLLLLKYYHHSDLDSRNRIETEFNSVVFMWDHGVRQIPEPLGVDFDNRIAIYTFIEGEKPKADGIDNTKIMALTDFLTQLDELSALPDSQSLPIASEAAFSLDQLLDIISRRLANILKYDSQKPFGAELKQFIEYDLSPQLEICKEEAVMDYLKYDITSEMILPNESTTLSPSDFGFHNAILNSEQVYFIDFEYFGRDDPAKTVSDFILHPAMHLQKELYYTFLKTMIKIYGDKDRCLKQRLTALYPLFAIKWCTILLNEFVPEHYERRLFALGNEQEAHLLKTQLNKAKMMLQESKEGRITMSRWLKAI